MSRLKTLVANVAAVVSGKAVAAIAGLATIMLLTRNLGPQEFGYYRTVLTFAGFSAVLADSGFYMVGLREMSRPGADKARVAGAMLPLRFLISVGFLVIACSFIWVFPYDDTVKRGAWLGAGVYACGQASELVVAILQSVEKQGRNAIAEGTGALVVLALTWGMALLGVGAIPMLAVTFFGALLSLAISLKLARGLVPFTLHVDLGAWRKYIVLGLPMAGAQIVGMAILRGDSLILSLFAPASDVGLYGVSTKLFEIATSLAFMIGGVMMPALTAAAAHGSREEFSRTMGNVFDTAAIYGVGAVLGLSPFAPDLLSLISGPAFVVGAPALVLISVAIALSAMSHVLRFVLVSCEKSRLVLQADAIACAVGFTAYFVLIPRYSLVGAAIGTVVAEGCSLIGMLRGVRRASYPLPSPRNLFKAIGAGAVAYAAMVAGNQFEIPWLLCLVMGLGIYLAILAVTHAIPPELVATVIRRRGPSVAAGQ